MTVNTDCIIPVRLTREFASADDCFMKCVDALFRNTKNIRVIFVDDNSDDIGQSIIEMVAKSIPYSITIRTHKQRWFTRAVNLGLRLVNTPWAVELNSDTVPQPGWLEELYSVAEESAKTCRVGLVGSVYSPEDPRRFIFTNNPDYVTGHCWLLNMQAMHEVMNTRGTTPGMFLDELTPRTIHIFSDNHLCYDLNRLQWLTVVSHHSHVDHIAGTSWGHRLHTIPNSIDAVNDSY